MPQKIWKLPEGNLSLCWHCSLTVSDEFENNSRNATTLSGITFRTQWLSSGHILLERHENLGFGSVKTKFSSRFLVILWITALSLFLGISIQIWIAMRINRKIYFNLEDCYFYLVIKSEKQTLDPTAHLGYSLWTELSSLTKIWRNSISVKKRKGRISSGGFWLSTPILNNKWTQ